MTTYKILTSLTNEDEGYRIHEWDEDIEDWLLNDDDTPNMGEIYRVAQREYGRCMSSVYVDREDGPPKRIGWYFTSREHYEDTGQPYLRGAWVTIAEVRPAELTYLEVGR